MEDEKGIAGTGSIMHEDTDMFKYLINTGESTKLYDEVMWIMVANKVEF